MWKMHNVIQMNEQAKHKGTIDWEIGLQLYDTTEQPSLYTVAEQSRISAESSAPWGRVATALSGKERS